MRCEFGSQSWRNAVLHALDWLHAFGVEPATRREWNARQAPRTEAASGRAWSRMRASWDAVGIEREDQGRPGSCAAAMRITEAGRDRVRFLARYLDELLMQEGQARKRSAQRRRNQLIDERIRDWKRRQGRKAC